MAVLLVGVAGDRRARQALTDALTVAHVASAGGGGLGDDAAELVALAGEVGLQRLVADALRAQSGRSLDLIDLADRIEAQLEEAREMTLLRHGGLRQPSDADPGGLDPPTPEEARVWKELHDNESLRTLATRRDQAERQHQAGRLGGGSRPVSDTPARWRVTEYLPNGYYLARRSDVRHDGELTQTALHCWSAVPEAVPDMLRQWSVPAVRPLSVVWDVEAPRPSRQLPPFGYSPGHPGNDPALRSAVVDTRRAWEDQVGDGLIPFADAVARFEDRWPRDGIPEVLDRAALRLNSEEPTAPRMGGLLHGGHGNRHGTRCLGISVTTGWFSPGKVAAAGRTAWNDFESHRPDTAAVLVRSLLDGDADTALETWNFDGEPIDVIRVPGPAGPLYSCGSNGTHRIHTARMIGLPAVWGEIRQYTLPLRVRVPDLFGFSGRAAEDRPTRHLIDCWRGLLDRGLVIGEIREDPGSLAMTELCPDWAVAAWLLAEPADAIRWAANYERAYPGVLDTFGIPADAWRSSASWHDWLSSR